MKQNYLFLPHGFVNISQKGVRFGLVKLVRLLVRLVRQSMSTIDLQLFKDRPSKCEKLSLLFRRRV